MSYFHIDGASSTAALIRSSGGASLTVASGEGARFGSSWPKRISILDEAGALKTVLNATARSGDVLTISGAADSHADSAVAVGDVVVNSWTAGDVADLYAAIAAGGGGSGTVTSVGLTAPSSLLSVAGSPVTGAGTIALSLASQAVNVVFAGPSTGASAAPTFRALVAADVPALAQSKITNLVSDLAAKAADSVVVHKSGDESIDGIKTFTSPIAGSVTGTASNVTGTVAVAKGGTGLTSVGSANQVQGVNSAGTGLEYKTVAAGANVTVTHGANSITIAAAGGGGGSPLTLTSAATTQVPLTIQAASGQTADVQQWKDSTGAVMALVTAGGTFSSSSQTNSERFGAGSSTGGATSLAVGKSATTSGPSAIAIGASASCTETGGGGSLVIGSSASSSGSSNTVIGSGQAVSGSNSAVSIGTGNSLSSGASLAVGTSNTASNFLARAIGLNNTVTHVSATAIGCGLTSNKRNELIVGDDTQAGGTGGWTGGHSVRICGAASDAAAYSMGLVDCTWVVSTTASRASRATFSVFDYADKREGVRIESDGAQALLGFYGAAAVAKAASPGTASGTDAAVINAVVTALRNLGLVT